MNEVQQNITTDKLLDTTNKALIGRPTLEPLLAKRVFCTEIANSANGKKSVPDE